MNFNPDTIKKSQGVHPILLFNNANVTRCQCYLSKTIGLLRKLRNLLSRAALITVYKTFIRPHLHYGDILYDQAYNMSFH